MATKIMTMKISNKITTIRMKIKMKKNLIIITRLMIMMTMIMYFRILRMMIIWASTRLKRIRTKMKIKS